MAYAAICHNPPKASPSPEFPRKFASIMLCAGPSALGKNMEFSRFACSFQGHLGSQVAQLPLEINTVWQFISES